LYQSHWLEAGYQNQQDRRRVVRVTPVGLAQRFWRECLEYRTLAAAGRLTWVKAQRAVCGQSFYGLREFGPARRVALCKRFLRILVCASSGFSCHLKSRFP
jgi:hypothetical protein